MPNPRQPGELLETSAPELRSSIELTKGAKEYRWNIKIYFADGGALESLDLIDRIDARLKADYGTIVE